MSVLQQSVARFAGAWLSPAGRNARLSCLIYHRVLAEPDPIFPDEVDVAAFDRQMAALATNFNVLPLAEAVERLERGTLPARAACVTFDDGYRDNLELALPILQRHGVHATFFIATGYLNGGRMFNDSVIEAVRRAHTDVLDLASLELGRHPLGEPQLRRQAIDAILPQVKYLAPTRRKETVERIAEIAGESLPDDLMMTTAQLRTLYASGMGMGGHTETHPILAKVDEAAAAADIGRGKETLEGLLGARVHLFAYPNGRPDSDYRAAHVAAVRHCGFNAAVSTAWGVATGRSDLFQLPRFTPWDQDPARFVFRLARNLTQTRYATATS